MAVAVAVLQVAVEMVKVHMVVMVVMEPLGQMELLTLVAVAVVVITITILVVALTQLVVVLELVVEVVDHEMWVHNFLLILLHQLRINTVLMATVVAVVAVETNQVMVVMV